MSEISDKRKLLRTLKEIKENLSWEYDKEYNKIWNVSELLLPLIIFALKVYVFPAFNVIFSI